MRYPKQSRLYTHENCVNFNSGLCTLNNLAVDPGGTACPNFVPKNVTSGLEIKYGFSPYTVHPWASQARSGRPIPYVPPPQTWYGYCLTYNTGPMPSVQATSRQSGARSLYMSSGRRGGGRGGRGRGRMGGFAAGPGGSCVCPRCGYTIAHVIGTPCYQQTCPKCGSRMTRRT